MWKQNINLVKTYFVMYAFVLNSLAAWLFLITHDPLLPGLLVALSLAALPFIRVQAPEDTLLRWAFHCSFASLVILQAALPKMMYQQGMARAAGFLLWAVMAVALAVSSMTMPLRARTSLTSLFGQPESSVQELRSAYELQIREAAGQEERNRLARDLHDSIKQQIFAIQTSAAAAQARFTSDAPGAQAALAAVRSSAREAMVEMEAMLDQLRATPLEAIGLVEALKKQAEALSYRTGAQVDVTASQVPAIGELPPGAAQTLFRIAQEGMANIAKHARASKVMLCLTVEGGNCVLSLADNGSGFDTEHAARGMGLSNIKSRAAEQGGSVSFQSRPGEGTKLRVQIPLLTSAPAPVNEARGKQALWLGIGAGAAVLLVASFVVPNNLAGPGLRGLLLAVALSAAAGVELARRKNS